MIVGKFKTLGLVAALSAFPVTVGTIVIPTEAAAERGGKGNGNADRDRSERGNSGKSERGNSARDTAQRVSGNNGRGAIARELKGLNAAHASQNALESASPDSMPGKLYLYQQAAHGIETQQAELQEAESLLSALTQMTEERFAELNPDLDYAETISQTQASIETKQALLQVAEQDSVDALNALTGGRTLSAPALAELNALLGL